jgi:hypothetical protein
MGCVAPGVEKIYIRYIVKKKCVINSSFSGKARRNQSKLQQKPFHVTLYIILLQTRNDIQTERSHTLREIRDEWSEERGVTVSN